jgi:hypothetical protein
MSKVTTRSNTCPPGTGCGAKFLVALLLTLLLNGAGAREPDPGELIAARLALYGKTFPEIEFVHTTGGAGWRRDMARVLALLGQEATNLDYEHPPHLADALLDVSLQRLSAMMRYGAPSASLFRAGYLGKAHRKRLCVINVDPAAVAPDDQGATRAMLDIDDSNFARIDPGRYLDNHDHLRFVVDHEVYHCLDSYYNGPTPMSERRLAGEFDAFENEIGADLFGAAMHVHDRGRITDYVKNLVAIRALSLYNNDPDHYTYDALMQIMGLEPATLAQASPRGVFDLATVLRNAAVPSYGEYVRYRAAALQAAHKLGVGGEQDIDAVMRDHADEALARSLAGVARSTYAAMLSPQGGVAAP